MIDLSFSLIDKHITDVPTFSEDAIRMDLLEGELTFVVNGADLAWKGFVPMLDLGRRLYHAVRNLSAEAPDQSVELLDYYDVVRIRLCDDAVELYSEYTRNGTSCDLDELRYSVVRFAQEVLRQCYRLYPSAFTNRTLAANYPLGEADAVEPE